MKKRITIEIDDDLLARARRALGNQTTRATVEEALRRLAEAAEGNQAERAAKQLSYLERLSSHIDVAVLASEEMWDQRQISTAFRPGDSTTIRFLP